MQPIAVKISSNQLNNINHFFEEIQKIRENKTNAKLAQFT